MQLHAREFPGNGTPLVLLHGFLGSAQDWLPLCHRLTGQHCLAIDLPGHGLSLGADTLKANGFEQCNQAILETLRRHQIERCHLLGYSLGGRIALSFACHYPQAVHSLILENAHPGLGCDQQKQQRREHDRHWATRFADEPLSEVLESWYQQPVFGSLTQSARQRMIESRLANSPRQLAAMLKSTSLGQQDDLGAALSQQSFACCYISGQLDVKFETIARELKQQCQNLKHISIENAGHNIHSQHLRTFSRVLCDWLQL
ncbi:2-succinyl-6-hydroxy-2,4-cyclohexadiene-1-carboxylate synthase [Dongshaea marina]|uniref:2-succinyl-6-hydroxy-2, 4-cyclohexadiene-1-carboxylate synthase n=1 Tax=Dongshaea marina TaxID=2047966 RepID=UPI00131F328D|nr:2-succinyl-6-hydroxy-2,4-cyclohexadiene-1-carboxylate synthase [Dongshaea marina]